MAIPPGLAGLLNDGPPVAPRLSASVLVIDPRPRPWTLLMMERPGGAEFAPSAYVFPGGSVHPGDLEFGDPSRAAAVRELFEELGLLLARSRRGRFAGARECEALRDRLLAGQPFPAALAAAGLEPAFDRLSLLARWITPEALRRRFDTRFFVARLPARQRVLPQAGEVVGWTWTSPAAALAEGGLPLVHVTRRILESVAAEPEPGRLIRRLRRRRREPLAVRPRLTVQAGGAYLIEDELVTA